MHRMLVGTAQCRKLPVRYYLLAEELHNETETYGVGVEYNGTLAEIHGITISQRRITALLYALIMGTVTPIALRDVVEDWLLT